MILTRIRLGIAAKRVKSLPCREFISLEEGTLQKVGVILDTLDDLIVRSFEEMFRDIALEGVTVETVFCVSSAKKMMPLKGISFKPGDIGWTGKINNARVAAFVEQDLDLLIAFTTEKDRLATFLMEASGATLKVSRGKGQAGNPDVIISTSVAEVDIFIAELKKYLRIINKST